MTWQRAGTASAAALVLFSLGGAVRYAGAQATPASAPPASKSVFGKLASIDKTRNAIVMKSDGGESLAWQFNPRVIAQAAQFKPGDPMIVIYRGIAENEKRVTAVAFPGSAKSPIYVNTTGSRVAVRSAPAVNGTCPQENPGPITEAVIPAEGMAEVLEGCWCCAVPGQTCSPANRSGLGRALLVSCFK